MWLLAVISFLLNLQYSLLLLNLLSIHLSNLQIILLACMSYILRIKSAIPGKKTLNRKYDKSLVTLTVNSTL